MYKIRETLLCVCLHLQGGEGVPQPPGADVSVRLVTQESLPGPGPVCGLQPPLAQPQMSPDSAAEAGGCLGMETRIATQWNNVGTSRGTFTNFVNFSQHFQMMTHDHKVVQAKLILS